MNIGIRYRLRSHRLEVRTSAFHAEDRGSIPLGTTLRDVAQSGSAPALGAGCRGFKSLHPDTLGAISSVGRAPRLHRGRRRFEPVIAHHLLKEQGHVWSRNYL